MEEPSWFDKDIDDFDITMEKMADSKAEESKGRLLIYLGNKILFLRALS